MWQLASIDLIELYNKAEVEHCCATKDLRSGSRPVKNAWMDENAIPSNLKLQSQTRALTLWQELDNFCSDKTMDCPSSGQDLMPASLALSKRHGENEKTSVSQRFRDGTCLYTDEKLQESKEFDDSLGVLHSNKELLLKFLNKLDSLFAKHLHDLSSAHEFHYGHVQSIKSSALKYYIHTRGCESGRAALGPIDISFSRKHQYGFQSHFGHGQVSNSHTSSHVPATGIFEDPIHGSGRGKASVAYWTESFMNWEAKKRMFEKWRLTHRFKKAGLVSKESKLGEMLAILNRDMRPSNLEAVITHDGHFGRFMGTNGLPGSIGLFNINSKDGWKDGCVETLSRS
ncbi:hypothetical protein Nepgr_010513 [Nepenthes gracilis]|uniref:DUF3741 domain-containing protein n=1 Tax=Nepenthes gracilis TaxID=150966 RepID=A0AAD3SCH2_NEPGR|nr:hypothetical protein Nepgr_010513 [Nepenthes gracilis]